MEKVHFNRCLICLNVSTDGDEVMSQGKSFHASGIRCPQLFSAVNLTANSDSCQS